MKSEKNLWLLNARRSTAFIRPHTRKVIVIMAMALVTAALGAIEPLVMKRFFDRLGANNFEAVTTAIIMLIALNLAREAIGGISNWLTWKTRLAVNQGLLEATVGKLHALPLQYHREETVGGIMTKLDRGINGFVGALSDIAFNTFPGVIYLVISIAVMFRLDFRLSLIVLFFAPLPAVIGMLAANEQTERDRTLLGRWTGIFSRFNEVLSGILTVKSFATEEEEKSRFMSGMRSANSLVLRGVGIDTGVGAAKNIVGILARVAALAAGGYLVIEGEITAGTLVAFLGYAGGIFGPVQGLTGVYQTLRRATVSLDIIFSILDAEDGLDDAPHATALKELRGEVVFDRVSFSYKRGNPVLEGIDLRISPGEIVALVGPSGAGKTTMTALLQRFYDPLSGSIRIDGVDLKDLEQRFLRRRIGAVSQEALLFNDTVKNNIAYGSAHAGLDEIAGAAKAANAHGFITRLPHGYDTVIGERGNLLSAGERQRLTIARALIKDPPILILDEATSSLDAESESLVQEALARLMRNRTTFVIAHRLSTVIGADRILVLKDGRIIEEGSHPELLKAKGYYALLVRNQAGGLFPSAA